VAKTLTTLQARLSNRMSEDSVPTPGGNEYNRRTQFLNEGYNSILRKHYWWWTEASDTFDSVADQTSYTVAQGFPSDIRGSAILELRFNGTLYTPVSQSEAFGLESSSSGLSQRYYVFGKKLWPVAPFSSTVVDGIALKYYKISTELSSGSDTIDIPDEYSDILVAFALGRLTSMDGERGSAADTFDEFNEMYKDMEVEQNNYLHALKSSSSDTTALFP
jgi:hypothetical protein